MVLRRKGVPQAQTCHSMIYMPKEDPVTGKMKFILALDGPASDADLIMLDEVSMIGQLMAADFRKFGKKILVMGDPGQLPPVGDAGAFTNRTPDVFLSEVHRQALDSPILRIATMLRQAEEPPCGDYGDGVEVLLLNKETQRLVYREETQPICGIHRVRYAYTQRIRRLRGFEGPVPLAGERIMCVKNSREAGLVNGMLGVMKTQTRVSDTGLLRLHVDMEEIGELRDVIAHPYHFTQHFIGPHPKPRINKPIEEFDWSNVLTLHKAQGSEYDDVTVVDDSAAFREDWSKWGYTAATRASKV
jgi:exodeoxyribonuclease-5